MPISSQLRRYVAIYFLILHLFMFRRLAKNTPVCFIIS
ncbi:hypothetical protein BTHERMOSOX_1040 [Bathymodiolus thermophilus thioautotrophic gill symbiont]|nr:hypothetical protein BTHERMOSOX_1040 [Bathymodiolus thermophilus thioautotrophic gill symbiont]